ncbi:M1-specific T cell receptor alpha chain-like [Melospiza georgiana]|uniref:M1-specific T cell receptor alpha chain-like n=1 Tax=Melospiza georgiana TaxID=44398 RepID=UPI0025AC61F1|nr:M1-specific T cell receptor alpha chain-like [Melospiza georgiana]
MQLAYLILTVFLGQLLGTTGQDTVTQEHGPVLVKQGHPFHTTCKYHTSNFRGLLWYQLRKGEAPELISYQAGAGPKRSGRFTTQLNTTDKSSVLQLEEVELSDSALYLCAVQDTLGRKCCVTSGSGYGKLTFGSGTRLSIQPKVTPSPSVYRLTSKDAQGLEMCLITDYSPEKLNVSSAEQRTSAVVGVATDGDSEESSYLSTYWATSDHLHCAASHEGFGELEGEDPESGASAVCVTGLSLHFRTDEHLNTISLSQLGLKIVLMKGIIFNVLMTVLVWKKKKD